MIQNNNLSCLPFYSSLDEQNHNKEYAFGKVYPLLCRAYHILPFFISRENRTESTFTVKMYNLKGEEKYDLSEQISDTGLTFTKYDGYDIIWYNGKLPMAVDMAEGFYYLSLTDGTETWYSEVFQIVNATERLLCLAWWDEEPLYYEGGCIPYNKSEFINYLYFQTQVGKPEYNFTEEGEERDGYFFPVSQLSEKTYKFVAIVPEFICDVLRTIRMSDHVVVTSLGKTYNVDSFNVNVEWQDQGDLASVTCEFETDTIVKKLAKAVVEGDKADYNTDFNDDYFN